MDKGICDTKSKKPVLFLHIGTHKTGTTALQVCMAKNQKFLMENKICYTEYSETLYNHAHLLANLSNEYKELIKNIGVLFPEYLFQPIENIIERMKTVFYKNKCNIMVMSSEDFYAHPLFLECLKLYFMEFEIKIICYLRRQDNFIESNHNQVCKVFGNICYYDDYIKYPLNIKFDDRNIYSLKDNISNRILAKIVCDSKIYLKYYTTLSIWAQIYGKENIIVRPYEKSQLSSGIEYDFFTNVLGLDRDVLSELDLNKKINESVKKDIIEYEIATKLFEKMPGDVFYELNQNPALAYLAENNKKNILPTKLAEEILEYYKEENEKIAREYLGREDGILFYDKRREEKDDYPGLSLQAAIDISRELIRVISI